MAMTALWVGAGFFGVWGLAGLLGWVPEHALGPGDLALLLCPFPVLLVAIGLRSTRPAARGDAGERCGPVGGERGGRVGGERGGRVGGERGGPVGGWGGVLGPVLLVAGMVAVVAFAGAVASRNLFLIGSLFMGAWVLGEFVALSAEVEELVPVAFVVGLLGSLILGIGWRVQAVALPLVMLPVLVLTYFGALIKQDSLDPSDPQASLYMTIDSPVTGPVTGPVAGPVATAVSGLSPSDGSLNRPDQRRELMSAHSLSSTHSLSGVIASVVILGWSLVDLARQGHGYLESGVLFLVVLVVATVLYLYPLQSNFDRTSSIDWKGLPDSISGVTGVSWSGWASVGVVSLITLALARWLNAADPQWYVVGPGLTAVVIGFLISNKRPDSFSTDTGAVVSGLGFLLLFGTTLIQALGFNAAGSRWSVFLLVEGIAAVVVAVVARRRVALFAGSGAVTLGALILLSRGSSSVFRFVIVVGLALGLLVAGVIVATRGSIRGGNDTSSEENVKNMPG